jgi:MFS family permease
VAVLFFANGALFANVVPRYPDLKAELGLSNAALGSAVAAYGLGALVVGMVAGVLVSRWGSVRVAPVTGLAIAANLVLLGLAPTWLALATALFAAGSLDAIADVANNSHGMRVERRYGRSILNSLHGLWSVGAVLGGAMGAGAAGLGLALVWHFAVAAGLFAALAVGASRFLLPGLDNTERPASADGTPGRGLRLGRPGVARRVLALGVIAALAQVMEDTGGAWGVVYLREDLDAAAAVSGLGFVALQTCQTFGRLLGDRAVSRYGDRAVARAGTAVAGGAITAALALPATASTVLALGAIGLGIGTLIPASMRTADNLPGLPRGLGLTMAGTVNRIAMLAAPPLIGVIADSYGLRAGLLVIPLAAALVLLLASALPASPSAPSDSLSDAP